MAVVETDQAQRTTTGAATYTAAVVHDFAEPLVIEQVPARALEPGQIRVKVVASGLCHTDIHAAHGDWPVKPSPPFIPGHEGIGRIESVGASVTDRAPGDRGAIAWLGSAWGHCRHCVSGWETLCPQQRNSGYSVNGAFAEYAVV